MRKMTQIEIQQQAKKIADNWLATFSLDNAKKVCREVRRILIDESNRRKKLKG